MRKLLNIIFDSHDFRRDLPPWRRPYFQAERFRSKQQTLP